MPAAVRRLDPVGGPTDDFIQHGFHEFARQLDAGAAGLLEKIRATRSFDGSLFVSEGVFDVDPQHVGANPRPGRNLLETRDDDRRSSSAMRASSRC